MFMEQKRHNSSDEIDLMYFFRPVSNAFKKLWSLAGYWIMMLAFNRYLFAGILLLGTLAGYCLRYVIKPAYSTEAIFTSDMLPARYCTTLLGNLNELRKPGNIPELARQLNISENAAWQIQGLTASTSPKDTFVVERRDSSMSVFRVTLVLADIRYVEEIQRGLVSYLENNDHARRRKEAKIKHIQSLRAALDANIVSLDSLRKLVNSSIVPRSQGQGIILGEPINPVSIYQAEMSYLKERLHLEERLASIDHIEVLQPFFKLSEKNTPDYDKMLKYAFALSFLFAVLIVPIVGRRPKK
jgi:hypothetical protein